LERKIIGISTLTAEDHPSKDYMEKKFSDLLKDKVEEFKQNKALDPTPES